MWTNGNHPIQILILTILSCKKMWTIVSFFIATHQIFILYHIIKIHLWYDNSIPVLFPFFLLMKNPHHWLTGIYLRTILFVFHLYSKWQSFTYRIIYIPHLRQVAKLLVIHLVPMSYNKRQTFTSIHRIAKTLKKASQNFTVFQQPYYVHNIILLNYSFYATALSISNLITNFPCKKSQNHFVRLASSGPFSIVLST